MDRIWPRIFLSDARLREPGKVFGVEPEPLPTGCPNCGGSGLMFAFFVEEGPLAYARNEFCHVIDGQYYIGHYNSAPCPACSGDQAQAFLTKLSGLRSTELEIRLDQFEPYPGKEHALEITGQLLAMCPFPKGYVTYWSAGFGVGKTHLLMSLVNGYRIAGIAASYTVMADLLSSVRDRFSEPGHAASEILREYRGVKVLAIDEIDKVSMTPWAAETIYRLMDGRYRMRDSQLTAIAMNCEPDNLALLDERLRYLSSRMSGGVIVEVGGMDMRPAIGAQAEKELEYATD